MAESKIKVEEMFKTILEKTNELIEKLSRLDPASKEYAQAMENLAASFQVLNGVVLGNKKESK